MRTLALIALTAALMLVVPGLSLVVAPGAASDVFVPAFFGIVLAQFLKATYRGLQASRPPRLAELLRFDAASLRVVAALCAWLGIFLALPLPSVAVVFLAPFLVLEGPGGWAGPWFDAAFWLSLPCLIGWFYLPGRLALAPLVAATSGRQPLRTSWRLTRGHGWAASGTLALTAGPFVLPAGIVLFTLLLAASGEPRLMAPTVLVVGPIAGILILTGLSWSARSLATLHDHLMATAGAAPR